MKRQRYGIGAGILICLLFAVGTGLSEEDRVATGPLRIVSVSPMYTEAIMLLGAQDQLVGISSLCQKRFGLSTIPVVGSLKRPDEERIIALHPDMVIGSAMFLDAKLQKRFSSWNIATCAFAHPKTFRQLCMQYISLGKFLQREQRARVLVYQAFRRLQRIKRRQERLGQRPKIFVQIGTKPLFTLTKDTLLAEYIFYAGGVSALPPSCSGMVRREQVIKKNPEAIVLIAMGMLAEDEQCRWQQYIVLRAVQRGHIYCVHSDKVCSPTPLSFVEAVEELAEKTKLITEKRAVTRAAPT